MSQKEETFLQNRVNLLISSNHQSIFSAIEEVLYYYNANLINKNTRDDLIKDIYEKFLEYGDYTDNINKFVKIIQTVKIAVPHQSIVLFNIEKKGGYKALAVDYGNPSSSTEKMVWFKSIDDAEKYLDNYLNANLRHKRNEYEISCFLTSIDKKLSPYSDDYGQGYQMK